MALGGAPLQDPQPCQCRLPHGRRVRAGGHEVRASREVRPGDVITLQQEDLTRTVRVKAVLENRVGAALVAHYMDDLTTPEEYDAHAKGAKSGV